ncbi:putative methyltransferase-domain-containing protein [Melanogaster broomeanus]|nr:putative methyltransferase-domain-containing protein [Melanogaster broomeanus]
MSVVQAPTSYLPPIAKIATFSPTQLLDALLYLKSLYLPEVRGSRRRRVFLDSLDDKLAQIGANSHPDAYSDLHLLRSDVFERSYAIRWLTTLIAQIEARGELLQSGHVATGDLDSVQPLHIHANTDVLIQQAASLLAVCAGVSAAGRVQRVFSFDSAIAGRIEVPLTDIPLENQDYASVGAQTWGAACVLAEMIVESPDCLDLGCDPRVKAAVSLGRALRVLELGAGTGLVGLAAAKLIRALPAWKNRRVTVVATDFHPSVLDNLRINIEANFPTTFTNHDCSISITSHFLDWSSFPTTETKPDIFSRPFDIIFGADVVYEAQHAVWIRDCLKSLLRYPEASDVSMEYSPAFHLVIPLRPTHTFESGTIEAVFGWNSPRPTQRELVIFSKEVIVCEADVETGIQGSSGDNNVEYGYYKIGWSF